MGEAAHLRWAGSADYTQISDVIYDAVRNGPSHYTDAQRAAWVPERRSGPDWTERLDAQAIVVAEQAGGLVGLISLADGNYIDFAFIRPCAQGSGLFRRLYVEIETRARANGQARLWVHASLMAEPAVASVGFTVIEKEVVAVGAEKFARFRMEKLF